MCLGVYSIQGPGLDPVGDNETRLNSSTVDCSVLFCSSRIIDALGHTLTPLRPVRRQLSGLLPADAHALQVALHDVHPVHPWPSRLPFVSFQFPLHGLLGILESSIRSTCPNHLSLLSLMMSSSFRKPVFFLMSSFFTLSFHEIPSSLRWNL